MTIIVLSRWQFKILLLLEVLLSSQTSSLQISCKEIRIEEWIIRSPSFGNSINERLTCQMAVDEEEDGIYLLGVTLTDVNDNVTVLNFPGSKEINFLPVRVDRNFPKMFMYNANNNYLKKIAKINFINLKHLVILSLAYNQIERIDEDTFDGLGSLELLILINNRIKQMNGAAIVKLNKLRELHLSENECIDLVFKCLKKRKLFKVSRTITDKCGFRETSADDAIESKYLFTFPCGEVSFNQGFIIGGNETIRGQWPFIVALYLVQANVFFCGGVLIDPQHVLTAAHCIQNKRAPSQFSAASLQVVLGQHNLKDETESGSVRRNVSQVFVHPAWDPKSLKWDADIAILLLDEPVNFESFIQPVCVPNKLSIEDHHEGTVVGWGRSENNRPFDSIPRQVTISSVNDSYCYTSDFRIAQTSSLRTFCAGGQNTGPCHGDSGSGFFVKVGSTWNLRGIVSSSMIKDNADCDVGRYTIFTKIIDFADWIKSVTSRSS